MIEAKPRRLFIGLAYQPNEKVTGLLQQLQDLARQPGSGLRPVAPANLHVTLRFLGLVPESDLALLQQVMDHALSKSPRLQLRIRDIGFFSRAIWLGIEPDARLTELVTRLNQALTAIGSAPDDKPYVPHLTVARLQPGGRAPLSRLRDDYGGAQWDVLRADAVTLFESTTLAEGARYTIQYQVSLANPTESAS